MINTRKAFQQLSLPLSTYAFILTCSSFSNSQPTPSPSLFTPSSSSSSFNMGKGSRGSNNKQQHHHDTADTMIATGSNVDVTTCNNNSNNSNEKDPDLPTIIVFDLDDCLWTPEMHELSGMPSIPVEGPLDPNNPSESTLGTIAMRVPSKRRGRWGGGGGGVDNDEMVELYPGARLALRELALNPKYRHVQIAVASSSLEPSYSRACIHGIEIVPDVTMKDMIRYAQIGREGKLTSRKTSHLKLIHEESGGVPYGEMLFFDDCNWGDHVGDLNRALGVVGVRTPNGLTLEEFHRGLELYKMERRRNGD